MKKFAVVFPGQGSHFIGMNKALYDEYKIVRDTVNEAEKVTGINLSDLCFNGPLSVLSRQENAHVAILTFGVAAFRVFVSETGFTPEFCAGHSLGEYTALVCSGAIKFSDALKLVQARCEISKMIQKKSDGGMTIIDGISAETVENICSEQQSKGKKVYVSCYNSLTQTAISGISDDLIETEKLLNKENGIMTPLFGSAPFHCPVMEEGKKELKKLIESMEFGELRYPVIANYTGKHYTGIEEVKIGLLKHLTNPVRWTDIISYFSNKGIDYVIDFSAKNVFENMILGNNLETVCFGNRVEREKLIELFNTDEYFKHKATFVSKCILAAISTPNKNFNEEEYKKGVMDKYNKIVDIKNSIDTGEITYTDEVKKDILIFLKSIFDTKRIDSNEENWWFQKILEETASNYNGLI